MGGVSKEAHIGFKCFSHSGQVMFPVESVFLT